MKQKIIRAVAGSMVLLSVSLGYWVNENWFFLTAFVGLNLLQSSLTRWCLLERILGKMGISDAKGSCSSC